MKSLPPLNLEALDRSASPVQAQLSNEDKIARIVLLALLTVYLFTTAFFVFLDVNQFEFRQPSYLAIAILIGFLSILGLLRWISVYHYDFPTLSWIATFILAVSIIGLIYYFFCIPRVYR